MFDISFFEMSIYEIAVTTIYIINFMVILNLIFREKKKHKYNFNMASYISIDSCSWIHTLYSFW